jgi:hypothetical protein
VALVPDRGAVEEFSQAAACGSLASMPRLRRQLRPSLVVTALALSLGAVAKGAFRTRHPVDGAQKGVRRWEAYFTTIAISGYTLVMMIFMP